MLRKNYILSRLSLICLTVVVLLTASSKSYAQLKDEFQNANWVFNICECVEWPNDSAIETFVIGVFGSESPELVPLDTLSKKGHRTIHGKPVRVVHFRRVRDMIEPTHVLFVSKQYRDNLKEIDMKLNNCPTLVIADSLASEDMLRYVMVNLHYRTKPPLNYVSQKAKMAGLIVGDKLTRLGGSDTDLKDMSDNIRAELLDKENELLLLDQELNRQRDDINTKLIENDIELENNQLRQYDLQAQEKEIEEFKVQTDSLKRRADSLMLELRRNQANIERRRNDINDRTKERDAALQQIKVQNDMINQRTEYINKQEETLKGQTKTQKSQNRVQIGGLIFAGIIIILIIITTISNVSRKKKNRQLEMINDEVDRQKDHILAQSNQLVQINKELEKLSIVASQTDNGVVIMDNLGNIEWVNRGFTNMYGYNANDLKTQSMDCLTGFYASNEDISSIKDECISTSESRIFECEIKTKQGKSVWIQSTLTPILDDNNEIGRLVTIDTDITQIKEQELAIMKQGETLALQRDELAQQNEFITEQNAHISTSLTYAKTIQDTVMPLEVNITKYFKYFGIFIPLQIVSGDFYWFSRIPDDEKLAFTAAVDCTGHGVPGAFMCMITTRLLSEIIVEHKVYDTKEILTQLNDGLVAALKQNETDNNDSLEICLCKFNHIDDENYEVTFSGAKRPLYVYHDETQQFDILKGDRKTIGGIMSKRNTTEFTSDVMILKKNDKLYLTSDGFVNQFDVNNKKYGSDKFVTLLKSIASMTLPDQKIVLEQEYEKHRGTAEQNDDVTIFALQLI